MNSHNDAEAERLRLKVMKNAKVAGMAFIALASVARDIACEKDEDGENILGKLIVSDASDSASMLAGLCIAADKMTVEIFRCTESMVFKAPLLELPEVTDEFIKEMNL